MRRRALVLRLRRVALDWAAPTVILVIGIVNVSQQARSVAYPGPPGQHLAFLVVAVAGLGVRRRAPLLAPFLTIAVVTWWTTLWPAETQGPFEGFLLMVGAAYCLGSLHDRRKLATGAGTLAAWFVIGMFVDMVGGRAGDVAPIAVWLAVGFGVGYLISRRTEQARQAWQATRILAAEQERQTARAVEDERARIARELHDVVAHGLSVIVVQAGAERRSLHGPEVDEQSVDAVLGSIERVGREALVDLRRLLGLLRRTDEPVALSPQPGLAQLDDLLSSVREAGLQVDVDISGDRTSLPPGLDLTAYRIMQEALTNVLKHANAHCVRVGVAFQRTHLDLEVTDDGSPGPRNRIAAAGPGHGLIGMRERVNVFGGTVSAGTAVGGGWSVHARLPVTAVGVG
ncbi:MAG TPA: sensor histidine kinase [Nocardioides sp.]|jgi:signal transduction histidine kinase|uniref:sensor histidine kinase n=1 Tax=Nocardioides sp. TaxID=35761 RepID=UPI002E31E3A3|nr:sensor histidine kinase [Nocardioides sp.]HEX3930030.1 sensor histidine kinase [Nocardioides sp.]